MKKTGDDMTTEDDGPSSAAELVINELATRIGKLTSQYEVEIAVLRAQASQQIEALQQRLTELTSKAGKDA